VDGGSNIPDPDSFVVDIHYDNAMELGRRSDRQQDRSVVDSILESDE
jgi:hypothetical protein